LVKWFRGRRCRPVFKGYFTKDFNIGEKMIPSNSIIGKINADLAGSEDLWGSIAPNAKIMLVINNFVPNPGITLGDLTPATFTGSSPILIPFAPQNVVLDNQTGRPGISFKEPVGGYKFICTATPGAPEVVYGWAVIDADETFVMFTDVLTVPITIANIGNFVELTADLGYIVLPPYGNIPAV